MIACCWFILAAIADEEYAHPVVSSDGRWIGIMVLVICGLFLAAAVIGPIVRSNAPDELPAQSHDEPPGASHQHGDDGLIP